MISDSSALSIAQPLSKHTILTSSASKYYCAFFRYLMSETR